MINKSMSEPISIVQKTAMTAYTQSETMIHNSPPKHSVIDFSSYLIQKRAEKTEVTECTKSANSVSESVQKKCSLSEVKQSNIVNGHMTSSFSGSSKVTSNSVMNKGHDIDISSHVISGSSHTTCSTVYHHEKESKHSETVLHNIQKDVDLNVANSVVKKEPKPIVPYAKPKKGKSNLYSTTSIDLLNLPENTYFTSNLSDKLSDYEDIWKTNGSVYGVGSVQADIINRLQPNLANNQSNNSPPKNILPKERSKSLEKEMDIFDHHKADTIVDEKEVFKDSGTEFEEQSSDANNKLLCEFCLCTDEQCTQCVPLETEGFSPISEGLESLKHNTSNDCETCDEKVLPTELPNFGPVPEQSDIESDICVSDDCHSNDEDHDADTEDCDYSAKNSVHTQTSPVVKSVPAPLSNICRKSASTSELLGLKSPVYSEPFDAINSELPSQNAPKVPKKIRRRSAPAFVASKRKFGTSQAPKLTPITAGLEINTSFDETSLTQCGHDVFSLEEREIEENCLHCSLSPSSSKEKKFKPTPNPRKTKAARNMSQKSDNSTPNRKSINDITNRIEKLKLRNSQSDPTKKPNIQVVDPIRAMEDFENSQPLSSPSFQKFPVYIKQFSGESNKTMCSESTTAEDIISSWNPELTLQPIKPFPVIIPGAMSEYDNLNSTGGYNYLDPSSHSLASAGTIFCKPWENSTLGKLMHTYNQFSPQTHSSAPSAAPPPLPAMDMNERIKAWQVSSQNYHSVPTDGEEDYRKSIVSDVNSVDAKTFGGDGLCMSEMKVSTNGQLSQSANIPVGEKKVLPAGDERNEDMPLFGADFREKILPVLGKQNSVLDGD